MTEINNFYIVKRPTGHCEIISSKPVQDNENSQIVEQWGPFESREEAIARRVGLIRAGKCQPQ